LCPLGENPALTGSVTVLVLDAVFDSDSSIDVLGISGVVLSRSVVGSMSGTDGLLSLTVTSSIYMRE
jgi:hypothetical protein